MYLLDIMVQKIVFWLLDNSWIVPCPLAFYFYVIVIFAESIPQQSYNFMTSSHKQNLVKSTCSLAVLELLWQSARIFGARPLLDIDDVEARSQYTSLIYILIQVMITFSLKL